VSDLEFFSTRWENIRQEVLQRLLGDQSLYDNKDGKLYDWIEGKEHARAILLVATQIAENFGMKLRLDSRETELMAKKFLI